MSTSRVHGPLSSLSWEEEWQAPARCHFERLGRHYTVLPHPCMCTSRVHEPLSYLSSEEEWQTSARGHFWHLGALVVGMGLSAP